MESSTQGRLLKAAPARSEWSNTQIGRFFERIEAEAAEADRQARAAAAAQAAVRAPVAPEVRARRVAALLARERLA